MSPHDFHIKWTLEHLQHHRALMTPSEIRAMVRLEQKKQHNNAVYAMRTKSIHGAVSRVHAIESRLLKLELNEHCNRLDYELCDQMQKRIEQMEQRTKGTTHE